MTPKMSALAYIRVARGYGHLPPPKTHKGALRRSSYWESVMNSDIV